MRIPPGIRYILFDLDNTLIDRDTAMRCAVQLWLMDQERLSEEAIEKAVDQIMEIDEHGYADRNVFCRWLLEHHAARPEQFTEESLLARLQSLALPFVKPFDQVFETVANLAPHYVLAIASNGSSLAQRNKMRQTGIDDLFSNDRLFISGEIGYEKPAPHFYQYILEALHALPEQCLMVGDDYRRDIEAAGRCGLPTCWLTPAEIKQAPFPDFTIQHISQLHTCIQS